MSKILKAVAGLAIGIAIGLALASTAVVAFTDLSYSSFFGKLFNLPFGEMLLAFSVGVGALIISLLILIPLHEGGHLLGGLISGYRFVSFRIFNLTLLKEDGKMKVKRFSIPGTGGQCLMTPPDLPLGKIPTTLYNLGGVAANLLALVAGVVFFFIVSSPIAKEALVIFILTDLFMIIMNGVPMKVSGLGNDAYNLLMIRKDIKVKRFFVVQLRTNALVQNGTMPEDLPGEWFGGNEEIDYRNPFEVSDSLMQGSRLLYSRRLEESRDIIARLYAHKKELAPLFSMEVTCEYICMLLLLNEIDAAGELLTPEIKTYIGKTATFMSSKERLLFFIVLLYENDTEKAAGILGTLKRNRDLYILKGETEADIRLMQDYLGNRAIQVASDITL